MPPARSSVLFARNLFLPDDLGGNRYPYETMRRMGARGHPVTVATPKLHARFPALENVDYFLYPIARPHPAISHFTNLASATLAMRRFASDARRDVAISGSYDAALALGWAGIVPKTPLVFVFHSEFYSEWVQSQTLTRYVLRRYMAAVERRVFQLSSRIVAVSQFSARQIDSRAPSAGQRIRVVPTGVETDYFQPPVDQAAVKRELGVPTHEPLVIGVGRLAGVKQFDRLITAFAVACARGLQAHLVIAGDGAERARLDALIDTYGMRERIALAGYCDPSRLRAYMQAADLQVCSSAFENLSLAILEAMACGTPVLGTPGGGTPELVAAIDPQLVLEDDHVHTMADALPGWLADLHRLHELGQRARTLAVEHYDWERVVDGLEAVCAEVVPEWR